MIDIKRLGFRVNIEKVFLLDVSQHEYKEIVMNQFAKAIANHVADNINYIPHTHTTEENNTANIITHTLKINIISDEEIKRLAKIEKEYNKLIAKEV